MKKIILDTNILLVPEKYKVDIFEEIKRICDFKYEIWILKQTIIELEKLKTEGKVADKRAASVGFSLIKSKDLKILSENEGYTDDIVVNLAKKGFIAVTQDKELKNRLKKIGAEYITLRQKKYLIIINKKVK
ncbi:hypothetical protein J4418_03465 [Candidatus Woesearchaeota archaeon]|nr:hypothetical protein [Candidatus Woesearchaeota archaeon]